ncbi:MAG: hypothetical protein H7Y04_04625 [Verrucomicrobia bacterium]|nr:hypothetical protein [Cytophagales bacterium]
MSSIWNYIKLHDVYFRLLARLIADRFNADWLIADLFVGFFISQKSTAKKEVPLAGNCLGVCVGKWFFS